SRYAARNGSSFTTSAGIRATPPSRRQRVRAHAAPQPTRSTGTSRPTGTSSERELPAREVVRCPGRWQDRRLRLTGRGDGRVGLARPTQGFGDEAGRLELLDELAQEPDRAGGPVRRGAERLTDLHEAALEQAEPRIAGDERGDRLPDPGDDLHGRVARRV